MSVTITGTHTPDADLHEAQIVAAEREADAAHAALTTAGDTLAAALTAAHVPHVRDLDIFTIAGAGASRFGYDKTGTTRTIEVDFDAAGRVAYFLTTQDATGTYVPGSEREVLTVAETVRHAARHAGINLPA